MTGCLAPYVSGKKENVGTLALTKPVNKLVATKKHTMSLKG